MNALWDEEPLIKSGELHACNVLIHLHWTFKAYRLLYAPPGLPFKISEWYLHYMYVFHMDLRTNSNFVLYIFNRMVFITEVESVYSAVRTESLYNTDTFRP